MGISAEEISKLLIDMLIDRIRVDPVRVDDHWRSMIWPCMSGGIGVSLCRLYA